MKIYSWNVNGIRAVFKKEALQNFLKKEDPDILLIQETKAKEEQLDELMDEEYIREFNSAEKNGYSGVSIWVKKELEDSIEYFKTSLPRWSDNEGRVLQLFLKGNIVVFSLYVPNGGKSDDAYKHKLNFFKSFNKYVNDLQKKGYKIIAGGDFNVAHTKLDLTNSDKEHPTHFNKEVRGHIDLIAKSLIDSYRDRNKNEEGSFTYWDNFSFSLPKGIRPRDRNIGWRLDYFFVDKKTNKELKSAKIHQNIMGSDHCPISITI